jgi:hypothetical protein
VGQTPLQHLIHHVAKNAAGTILPQDDRVFRCGNGGIDACLGCRTLIGYFAGINCCKEGLMISERMTIRCLMVNS